MVSSDLVVAGLDVRTRMRGAHASGWRPVARSLTSALPRRVTEGTRAVLAARAGAIAQTPALTLTSASAETATLALAFTLTESRTFRPRAAIGTNAAVLFQTRGLTCRPLFIRLRGTTVAPALATSAGAGIILGEGCARCQQAGHGHHCEKVEFHNCHLSFCLLSSLVQRALWRLSTSIEQMRMNRARMAGLQFCNLGKDLSATHNGSRFPWISNHPNGKVGVKLVQPPEMAFGDNWPPSKSIFRICSSPPRKQTCPRRECASRLVHRCPAHD